MSGGSSISGTSSSADRPLLIQVVPRLKPGRCGVSDQAVLIARELNTAFGIDSAFAVLNSNEQSDLPYPTVYCPPTKLLETWRELTQGRVAAALVHVSGYGYSSDGAPTLLADALEQVGASVQLGTAAYFHEIFASGPPWKSVFWHTRRQKRALRRIVAQCGLIVTSIEHNAQWLESESRDLGEVPVERIPVFSAAGEAEAPLPFAQRNPTMAVFGLAGTRQLAYRQLAATKDLIRTLGIEEILDVGPECQSPSALNGVPVKPMGPLPAVELPAVLSRARFGFVTHEWSYFARSSVLAAYCAQGTIPVLIGPIPGPADGLTDGVQVVSPQTAEAARRSGWETCSQAAWSWYMGHRLRVHAERYAQWIGERR
jgi:hypothetical protein